MVFSLVINTIFAQESADAAHAGQWRVVTDQLREKNCRGLATMMDAAEHEVLTFMDFPKEPWVKIPQHQHTGAAERRDQAARQRRRHLSQRGGDPPLGGGVVAGAERRVRNPETLHESGNPRRPER